MRTLLIACDDFGVVKREVSRSLGQHAMVNGIVFPAISDLPKEAETIITDLIEDGFEVYTPTTYESQDWNTTDAVVVHDAHRVVVSGLREIVRRAEPKAKLLIMTCDVLNHDQMIKELFGVGIRRLEVFLDRSHPCENDHDWIEQTRMCDDAMATYCCSRCPATLEEPAELRK